MITVFVASKVITMDPNCPEATHIAVRDGRVLAVGGPDCADGWGETRLDTRFADKVIMPGLIEAHAHVMAGGIWDYTYVGHYARTDPDGRVWEACTDYDAIIARMREVAARTPKGQPIVGWGIDPNFHTGERFNCDHVDQISTDHPVVISHSNFHLMTVNSAALALVGFDASTNIEGVVKGPDGTPNGELQEFAAMQPVIDATGYDFLNMAHERGLRAYGQVARLCGVTTVAELLSELDDQEVAMLERVVHEPGFPARYVPVMNAMNRKPQDEVARALALKTRTSDKLYFGRAKIFTDGAIQGYTAQLKWPGYFTGEDHGIWNMELDHFREVAEALHAAGIKTHIHTNGDRASEFAIEVYEDIMLRRPNPDLRHTLEHAQLATRDQFKRMKALGLTCNLVGNHIHYFGDIHWAKTLGPDRASRMNACRDAVEIFDNEFAIHSDAPITPMAPLATAWAAVNRVTQGGRTLGNSQQITVAQALHCITLGAAHVLKLDDKLGSLQCGKFADFCVLAEDPLAIDPMALREIEVIDTVLGGEVTE